MNRALSGVLLSLTPAEMLHIHQRNDTVIRIVERDGGRDVDHFVDGIGPVPGLPETRHKTSQSA
jgi:hypothetical protein